MKKASTNTISIAICTYNRAGELRVTLNSIAAVKAELVGGDEIIIVDNNSNDDTATAIKAYQTILPIKYVFEGRQGLSAARNAALESYTSDAIIYFDDDITVLPDTISAFRQALFSQREMGFFGGKLHASFVNGNPSWLKSHDLPMLNGLLGHYDLDAVLKNSDRITYPPHTRLPYGACFALRRTLVDTVGRFDEALGVSGNSIGRGEETDYFERAIAQGFVGAYLSDAFVLHRFPSERLKISHLLKYGAQKGVATSSQARIKSAFMMVQQLLRGLFQLCIGRKDRFYQCVINVGMYRARGFGIK